jgi:hypothetical protein
MRKGCFCSDRVPCSFSRIEEIIFGTRCWLGHNRSMARNLFLLVTILAVGVFAVSTAKARLGWTLDQSVEIYGPYKAAMEDVPGWLPGTLYGFLDKTADLGHPQLDYYVLESFLDGKVAGIGYATSDQSQLTAEVIQAALALNAPEADWSAKEDYFVGKVNGEVKYMGKLVDGGSFVIGTGKYFEAINAAKDPEDRASTAANAVKAPPKAPTPAEILQTNVVSAITGNRWTSEALVVSGTLTNRSTVEVQITGIDAKGFNQDQEMITSGSDFTIVHNDLLPGEVVNFKVALKDDTKLVRFVKVLPTWTP